MPKPDRQTKEVTDHFVRSLVDVIREARESRGLSQNKLAEAAGVGRTGIVTFEQYHRMPSMQFCKKLAAAMGVPLADLVREAESR